MLITDTQVQVQIRTSSTSKPNLHDSDYFQDQVLQKCTFLWDHNLAKQSLNMFKTSPLNTQNDITAEASACTVDILA